MRIQEIMTTDPVYVTPDTSLSEAARLMKDEDIGLLPVVDKKASKHLVGVVTDRDIAIRHVAAGDSTKRTVGDVMSNEVATCRAETDLKDAMDLMGQEQVRRIPIVDERGTLVGVIAQADIMIQSDDGDAAKQTVEQISQPNGQRNR